MTFRTDLAIESENFMKLEKRNSLKGVETETGEQDGVHITRVHIKDAYGETMMKKKMGHYVTLESELLRERDPKTFDNTANLISTELKRIIEEKKLAPEPKVLVVGLGNRHVTADSLGPFAVEHLFVTRHLLTYMPEELGEGYSSLAAISPGVMGLTGIETMEVVEGIIENIKPDVLLVIDALAARDMKRVASTIQLTDTGIHPGAGVGNNRKEMSQESLGIPVIAIGIPTVVDAATIANDSINAVIESLGQNLEGEDEVKYQQLFRGMAEEEKYTLIKNTLSPYDHNLIVTPKEIDGLMEDLSKILASGINMAFHSAITRDNAYQYLH